MYGVNNNYVADAADNLTTIRSNVFDTVNADNQSANLSQNYDGNGNPTDYLQYDVNDRLIDVKYLGTTVNHILSSYRSDGLRATKQVNLNGNTGTPTFFLYDGTRVLCELDASGNVSAAYGYGGAGLAQRYSATTATYTAYTFDPMGNVVGRMRQQDAPNVPFDMSAYDAFGQRRDYVSGAGLQNLTVPPDSVGYGGQLGNYTDVEANLILMGFRFYSPFYCRFLTRDPSGYEGGINLYAYCRNNPINRADPLGLDDSYWSHFSRFVSGMFKQDINSAVSDPMIAMIPGGSFLTAATLAGWQPFQLNSEDEQDGATFEVVASIAAGFLVPSGEAKQLTSFGALLAKRGTTMKEARRLVGAWAKDPVKQNIKSSLLYHMKRHGSQVSAASIWQFMRKAEGFNQNLKGSVKAYPKDGTPGAIRYTKNGQYIIKDAAGKIISYGGSR